MTTGLEPAIAKYFAAANEHDVAEMVATFAEEAVMRDEGQEHRGLAAIGSWIETTIGEVRLPGRSDRLVANRLEDRCPRLGLRRISRQSRHPPIRVHR
jgi:hypothetical protein